MKASRSHRRRCRCQGKIGHKPTREASPREHDPHGRGHPACHHEAGRHEVGRHEAGRREAGRREVGHREVDHHEVGHRVHDPPACRRVHDLRVHGHHVSRRVRGR